jgi:ubiquinone/menaquinone biosynthesis C-methylase UbiE
MTKLSSFDSIAPLYDLFASLFRRRIPEQIASRLQPGDRDMVLDLGGGTGYNSARIEGACRRVIVLDISFEMLRHARKYQNLGLVVGDARKLPFKPKTFDVILAVDSIHHIGDYTGVLKEVGRVGKHKLLVAEFCGRTFLGRMLTTLERFFFPVVYMRPDDFCRDASRLGIPGAYDYISGFEYFFLGRIQESVP